MPVFQSQYAIKSDLIEGVVNANDIDAVLYTKVLALCVYLCHIVYFYFKKIQT